MTGMEYSAANAGHDLNPTEKPMKKPFTYKITKGNAEIASGEAVKITDVATIMWTAIKAVESGETATISITIK